VRRSVLVLLASLGAGCGRIAFDPGDALVDSATPGDGAVDAVTACNIATPSLVQNDCATAAGATVSTSLPDLAPGNLLVVTVNFDSATANATVTDTAGNAMTAGETVRSAGSTSIVYFKIIASDGADTLTVTLDEAATFVAIFAHELTGVDARATSTSGFGTGTMATTPPLTTTVANQLLLGHAVSSNNVTSVGSGFASIQTCAGDVTAYLVAPAPAEYVATYTLATAASWRATLTAFEPCM
jgi:hypothetical protein